MLWSAPAPARSSSAAVPEAASVWPAAAAESAAPGSRWTGCWRGPAGGPALPGEAGRGPAAERTPPQTEYEGGRDVLVALRLNIKVHQNISDELKRQRRGPEAPRSCCVEALRRLRAAALKLRPSRTPSHILSGPKRSEVMINQPL